MHIHIIGICGTFMGGLAALAREAGHQVTGCDAHVYPPMSTQLEALGIDIVTGFEASQLDGLNADMYVIGNVAKRGMPVIEAILDRGLPYISGPQWLSEHILQRHWVLAVAGTHGKTTTSAMLAWILQECGLAPGFLIGGVPENFGVSARLPRVPPSNQQGETSPFFVIEADEYDTAFFDKRSKFVHYHPRTAVLNNLEFDHADIFADLSAIETQFHYLIRTIPSTGCVLANAVSPALQRVFERGVWTPVEYFGGEASVGWSVGAVDEHGHFDVYWQQHCQGRVQWTLMGEHNQMNALAAIAAARHVGVSPTEACRALGTFKNVRRRMEKRGEVKGVTVYDDFAHHPTAIATTIAGLRQRIGEQQRILAVLEPRSNTMKLGTMKALLADSLKEANRVFCFAPTSLGWNPQDALASLGEQALVCADFDNLLNAICTEARSGDQILVMSNGAFGGIHERLLQRLAS